MELNQAIKNRHSVRKFNSKKPDWRDIIECIDAFRYAPMAGNNFTLKFILINDTEKIQKLAEAAQQSFVATAPYVLVVCTNPDRTIHSYPEFGEKFCRQQAGSAIQNFLLKIEEKKLATCWVGYFVEEQIKRELQIPNNITVEAIFPIGYEMSKTKPKRKIDLDETLYFFKWKNKQMKKTRVMDV